jgi:hypothetical protein
MTLNQKIDELILHFTTDRWQKVAMVVASVLLDGGEEMDEVNDYEVADRVKVLASEGRIESRGDLGQIRYSEIRLPQ